MAKQINAFYKYTTLVMSITFGPREFGILMLILVSRPSASSKTKAEEDGGEL